MRSKPVRRGKQVISEFNVPYLYVHYIACFGFSTRGILDRTATTLDLMVSPHRAHRHCFLRFFCQSSATHVELDHCEAKASMWQLSQKKHREKPQKTRESTVVEVFLPGQRAKCVCKRALAGEFLEFVSFSLTPRVTCDMG